MATTAENDETEILARMEAKLEALTRAVEAFRAYLGVSGGGVGSGSPREITSTTFWGKTIPDAAKMFLGMVGKKPQSTQQIAEALLKGGMETNAKDFPGTVQAMLRRTESQTDEIIRVPSGEWALPDWFPDRPRKSKRKTAAISDGTDGAADEPIPDPE